MQKGEEMQKQDEAAARAAGPTEEEAKKEEDERMVQEMIEEEDDKAGQRAEQDALEREERDRAAYEEEQQKQLEEDEIRMEEQQKAEEAGEDPDANEEQGEDGLDPTEDPIEDPIEDLIEDSQPPDAPEVPTEDEPPDVSQMSARERSDYRIQQRMQQEEERSKQGQQGEDGEVVVSAEDVAEEEQKKKDEKLARIRAAQQKARDFAKRQEELVKNPPPRAESPPIPPVPPTPLHGAMTPIQNSFPDFPKAPGRDVEALRARARMMTGGPAKTRQGGPNPYAGRKNVKRKTDEERFKDLEAKARKQIRRQGSLTNPTAIYRTMSKEASSIQPQTEGDIAKKDALQRLSEVQGDKRKWGKKKPSDKLRMLVTGGIYGVFNLVVNGAGDPKANGVYEPAQPHKNRPQWKRDGWSLYWRDTTKGRRKGGEWVIQADHTYQYRLLKDDIIPPANQQWLKVKGKAPGPTINYRERKEPKQIDT